MAAKQNTKGPAWALFDRIVARAAPGGQHRNPWVVGEHGERRFEPDFQTLCLLLGVPLLLKANTQSGVPALALDVWLSYELRCAGFEPDQTWPRAKHPRILPLPLAKLLRKLNGSDLGDKLRKIIERDGVPEVTSASASVLGKNYKKQVDVIITDWSTGPELLISTKRMDSSYGKNAPNRVEESYGDAKNLRLRHPLAALGFVFGLRSDILQKEAATAEWLFDQLIKLGREDDAYHATCAVLMEYSNGTAPTDAGEEPPEDMTREPGAEPEDDGTPADELDVDATIDQLPKVHIRLSDTPPDLLPSRFLAKIVDRVLDTTPVTMHREARKRRAQAAKA